VLLLAWKDELATFPAAKRDDQADSTSQALDWFKQADSLIYGVLEYYRQEYEKLKTRGRAYLP